MKKIISFTASLEIDLNDYDDDFSPKSFEDVEDSDYDNVGRPINHLEDLGWKITKKKIK